ncbi:MAG TPA: DEAD/DEAH box helicase [Anaerolineaceae bacterium]
MDSSFEVLSLLPQLMQAVEKMGFETPTPIQLAAIPALIGGRNVVGQAQTGTGKTAAFALPMLQKILSAETVEKGKIQALVLAPTRELAIQVADAITHMATGTKVRVMAVYGGQSYEIQKRKISRGVEVVVGTPGRLLDLIRQKVLDLSQVSYLVLDEADEMLEMGFIEDVETILSQITGERQTALFSATLPDAVRKLADRYVSDPERINVSPTQMTVAETEQRYYRVRDENKLEALTRLLEVEMVKSALVFARTKARAQELADELIHRGYPAESLHGDLSQARRETVLNRFRHGSVTILVATDVAARGLDIEDVSHVINFDVPGDAEDYVHRIGRTGRAGKKGVAITFLHPRDRVRRKEIEAYTRQPMKEFTLPTRDEILTRRDERFIQTMYEQLIHDAPDREMTMVAQLVEMGVDPADIAAVAIKMARAGETALPVVDIIEPAEQPRAERKYGRREVDRGNKPERAYNTDRTTKNGDWSPRDGKRGKRPQEAGMVRLLMNLGDAQGLRPGDVVGAIASEAGIPGRAIGEIDIRRNCTFVDVAEKHVRQVLNASAGQYELRGHPVMLTLAS